MVSTRRTSLSVAGETSFGDIIRYYVEYGNRCMPHPCSATSCHSFLETLCMHSFTCSLKAKGTVIISDTADLTRTKDCYLY
ncbi:MAG: hypothetical protein Q4G61_07750 [Tissierellia bacterium]|nr:hypothetical protein [Tissierellia bacterium]